jgi:hypothetical protein
MSREYSFCLNGLASPTTFPFVQLLAPTACGICILGIELNQETDTTSVQLALTATRRSTTSTFPANANALAPVPLHPNDPASLLTVSATTTFWAAGTAAGTLTDTPFRWAFNRANGFVWLPTPEQQLFLKPAQFLTLQFLASPVAATWSGQIYVAENA